MATKFYLNNVTPPYTPGVNQGTWDDATSAISIALGTNKFGNPITSIAVSEVVTISPYNVLLIRAVSSKLQAQTISGTFNFTLGINENSTDADLFWYVHAYVTQGDTDIVRGILVNNYADSGTEWPNSSTAKGFATPPINPVTVNSGDRIVFEIGYISRNTFANTRAGTLWYGTQEAITLANLPDLTLESLNTNKAAGSINFSQDILFELVDGQIAHQLIEIFEPPPAAHAQIAHQIVHVDEFTLPTARIAHIVIQVVDSKFVPPPLPGINVSGIYFINPNRSNDNYYDNVVKKIPDPTIKSPLFGE